MSRSEQFYGAGSTERLFPNDALKSPVPWPQAHPTKTHRYYDPRKVDEALSNPEAHQRPVDPRGLHATQPEVTRAGVDHYMSGAKDLYADAHSPGNQHPVVFHDETLSRDVLLSGHHRAATALLRGEQFNPVYVSGQPATHADAASYQREQIERQRSQRQAAESERLRNIGNR
jgi:hypothetical protein